MSEPSLPFRPIQPDTSVQVSAARYGAIAMAAIALGGFLVAYATSGSDQRQSSSISSTGNLERPVFREDKSGIFVSLPPNADPSDARLSTSHSAERDRPSIVAQLQPRPRPRPRPSATAPQRPLSEPATAQPAHDATEPNRPAAAPAALDQPHERITDEPSPEPSLIEPTLHKPNAAEPMRGEEPMFAEHRSDEDQWDEPAPDHPMWDEDASYERAWDEDESSDDDGPMSDESFERDD
jgi:hypothetical protein